MQEQVFETKNIQVEAEKNFDKCDGLFTIKWKAVDKQDSIEMHYQIDEENVDEIDVLHLFDAFVKYATECKNISMQDLCERLLAD